MLCIMALRVRNTKSHDRTIAAAVTITVIVTNTVTRNSADAVIADRTAYSKGLQ